MQRCIAIACFLLATWCAAHAQTSQPGPSGLQQKPAAAEPAKIDPAKEADIRRLLELTGTKNLMVQNMNSMQENLRPLMTNSLPPGNYREKLVDLFLTKFRSKADPAHMIDIAVQLYDKYLSQEDIKGLIQFYQTPVGQKAISILPRLLAELVQSGQQWGQEVGRETMQEVLAEHPDLAEAMAAAAKTKP